jgi:hypothetical protein
MELMSSNLFDKMVAILEDSVDLNNIALIVEQHCELIGKTPDTLLAKDGGQLTMKLMSNLADLLSNEEWALLDNRFKKLLRENVETRAKVKGLILLGTQDYILMKRGRVGLNEVMQIIDLPTRIRADTWYPISVLDEFLDSAEGIMGVKDKTRARAIGQYIMSPKILRSGNYWFGRGQPSIYNAFNNICELLTLDDFSIINEKNHLTLSFKTSGEQRIVEFFLGLCKGIFVYRDIKPADFQIINQSDDAISICFELNKKKESNA